MEAIMEIGDILCEQDIVLGLPAKGKRSVLAKVATRLASRINLSSGAILAAFLHRERLGSTAIGHGVAIPHARLDELARPAAKLAVLEKPIWFGAPDGDDVDLVMALLWPRSQTGSFLPALANLCRLFRSEALRKQLRVAESAAEAMAVMAQRDPLSKPASSGYLPLPRLAGAELRHA